VFARQKFRLKLSFRTLQLGERTLIMGVLNVTPDSFSDGGNFYAPERAIRHALQMESDGAHIIDIGAESTRPGSSPISAEDEWARLAPVLTALRTRLKIPMSVDTRKAEIAEKAVAAGAEIINDVSGLTHDKRIAEVAARLRVPLILMHMRGEPGTMQQKPFARNVLADVNAGLRRSIAIARKAGVSDAKIVIDPGIGFGKSFAQNYELLNKLPELAKLGLPVLVGTSRKGFIGRTLGRDDESAPPEVRIWGTAATVTASILQGAHIVRVHDVLEMSRVARVVDHIQVPNLRIQK
jgi:dihydropteroate synthase